MVTDFNQTLVEERFLPAWCLDGMRTGPVTARLRWVFRAGLFGPLAIAADLAGRSALAARVGMRALAGVEPTALAAWSRARLTPRPTAFSALERLGAEAGTIRLLVVSRGTPCLAVRAFLERDDVRAALARARLAAPPGVDAPELAVAGGRFTGCFEGTLLEKGARFDRIPDGAVYLGDRHDERYLHRQATRRFRFERV